MKRKSHMYLVSNAAVKKKFNKFYIFMYDESIFEFDLSEWRVCKDEEWVEVTRLDNTIMESFAIQNIMRVKFLSNKAKLSPTNVTPLKSVS